jgi:D-xylonolactonase
MFRYTPGTEKYQQCYSGTVVGGFTIQEGGELLLFMAGGAVAIWRDGVLDYLIRDIPKERESRFNDVIADPLGRVFCGTLPADGRLGHLYRLGTDGTLTEVLGGIGCSNGMGFTPDGRGMYYTDTGRREISVFDYDENTGAISNRRVFARVPEGEGVPDGMTVDADGYVWSARWDGGCLVRYAPDGTEDLREHFPARKVSSLTFGGEDYADIYVTTAGAERREKEGPGAGALFRVNLGIRGVPEFRSRIGL